MNQIIKPLHVNNKYNLNFLMLIIRTFSVYIQKICIKNNVNLIYSFLEYYIHLEKEFLLFFFKILKSSLLFNYNYLSDIICVDNLNLKKNLNRFTLSYFLQNNLSYSRIALKTSLGRYESVTSINSIFLSSIWVEREIYDLFGIFFVDNMDLRRILTDYGFYGFPLQKDFPLTGYLELRYCEELKCVKYSRVKLMQEYRNFNFLSPWQHYLRQNTNFVAFD